MKRLMKTLVMLTLMASLPASAQQAQKFGDYTVHYSAMNTSLLTPEIAKAYGIRRSDSRGMVNISVLKGDTEEAATAVKAMVTATGRNLTGQTRTLDMREIDDGDGAVYYIGELSVRNMETFDFTVEVTPNGNKKPYIVKFRQQFYTE
jgi:alkanesulfonate monooxygenase SsuD/methylene tetrahydromethanopterin reductase-like flavin-dependent oxidoreductase (luciferase family)